MKFTAKIIGSLRRDMEKEFTTLTGAIKAGTKEAAEGLKNTLRGQITSAGMGTKLANAWRSKVYENKGYDSAGLVYTRAPRIVEAFDKGVLIKPKAGGVWLAVPTVTAPKRGTDGKRITPLNFPEAKLGKLEFVYRENGPSFLVVHNVRASYSRKTGQLRGFRKASDTALRTGKGLTTAIMFLLIRQVKLEKRLDVESAAKVWIEKMPNFIEQQHTKRSDGNDE
ncbi:MAG: DUF6441 family protein [Alphaproteobacteria bacterium]|nr:DUF6441 family protein [Alphaproteobacteria bacterium]